MPSFDAVSNTDMQEVNNAFNQTQRESTTRYDLKQAGVTVKLEGEEIHLIAKDQMNLGALQGLLKEKLAKRRISLKLVTFAEPVSAGGDTLKQVVSFRQGLTADELRAMNKSVKALKFKVTVQIQGDQLRVTGKKRDDLQKVITHLKEEFAKFELEFVNFRD